MKLTGIEPEYEIYGFLFSLSNRIQTIGDKEFGDITMKQHFLMVAIHMFEKPPTLRKIADTIGCSYQNVKRMAAQLEKRGYLILQQDPQDKRKVLLVLTDKMNQLAAGKEKQSMEFMAQLYQGIPKENLMITQQTLKKMDQNLGGTME